MNTSEEGLQLIEDSEEFRSRLYNCPAGHCTVGFGHLVHRGACNGSPSEAPFWNGVTRPEATQMLRTEVAQFETSIRSLVRVPIDQSEFDALVDFEYNLGAGALAGSTLLAKLNAEDYAGAQAEFAKWVYANHQKLSGLAARRAREQALFARDLPRVDL